MIIQARVDTVINNAEINNCFLRFLKSIEFFLKLIELLIVIIALNSNITEKIIEKARSVGSVLNSPILIGGGSVCKYTWNIHTKYVAITSVEKDVGVNIDTIVIQAPINGKTFA